MNIEEFKADLLRRFPFKPGYKFMAVDSDGWCDQYTNKPKVRAVTWGNNSGACSYVGWVELPDGVDWRETLVSRAEAGQPTQSTPTTNSNDAKVWLKIYCSIIASDYIPEVAANLSDKALEEYKKRFPNG